MKIIFTIPSLYGGGAERVLSYLIDNIKATEKILCTLESGQQYDLDKNIRYIKLTNIDGRSSFLIKAVFFFLQYFKFVFFISNEKPDIIISFLERSNIITILTPTKAKKIISIRSFMSKQFEQTGIQGRIIKIFYKFLLKKVDNFVVPAFEIKNDLVINFGINKNKIKVIYNPIDIKKINNLKKEQLEEKFLSLFTIKYNILINIGNLTYPKGQWHLIKVFSKLKEENKNLKLIILGEGNYLDLLIKICKNLKLTFYNNNELNEYYDIYFLGFQSNPYKFLYNSNIFISSSLREGFPNVLIEAMACELPIISSNCQSGPKEILNNGKYGILLPTFSGDKNKIELDKIESKWVKVINSFIKNNSTKLDNTLSYKRVNEFNLNKIISIWENYMKELK